MIAYLEEEQMDVGELEDVLKEIFERDENTLQNVGTNERSDIRRLIRIYDYLKWGKIKEFPAVRLDKPWIIQPTYPFAKAALAHLYVC